LFITLFLEEYCGGIMLINEKIVQMETEINALKKLEKEISERIDNLELKLLRLKAESIPEEEFDEDYDEIMKDIDESLKKGDTIPAEKLLKDLGL
jgi:uncharacterized coiled-coil DUF342 family protein